MFSFLFLQLLILVMLVSLQRLNNKRAVRFNFLDLINVAVSFSSFMFLNI